MNNTDKIALIDAEDFDKLDGYSARIRTWHAHDDVLLHMGKKQVYLHRLILGNLCDGFKVDHINRNPLDCRKENLRIVTDAENSRNTRRAHNHEVYDPQAVVPAMRAILSVAPTHELIMEVEKRRQTKS